MKKLILIGLASLIFACDSQLDIEPRQSLDIDVVYSSREDLTSAIIGSYNRAQDADVLGANMVMIPDLMSNNIIWGGSFTAPGEFAAINITVTNGDVDAMYADVYRLVNNVNAVLQSAESLSDLTPEEVAQFRGESLFLRGAIMFDAIRFFGKPYDASTASSDLGLPISLIFRKTTENVEELPRSSVEEVYQQAIADLTEAASLLPDNIALGRANRFTALGYLAKIYFQRRDYGNAADFAQQVISNGYSLVPNVLNYYTVEDNTEDIWSIVHTAQDNPGTNGSLPTFYNEQARGDILINPDLITNGYNLIVTPAQQAAVAGAGLTVEDERFTVLTGDNANGSRVVLKYESFANDDDNAPILRLPELLLMRAESIVRSNGGIIDQESIDLLNQVRLRSLRLRDGNGDVVAGQEALVSYTAADFATVDDLIDAIILERRVELSYEGNRFHDLNRLGLPVKGVAFGDNARVFPIPQDAMQNNSALVQNPGY